MRTPHSPAGEDSLAEALDAVETMLKRGAYQAALDRLAILEAQDGGDALSLARLWFYRGHALSRLHQPLRAMHAYQTSIGWKGEPALRSVAYSRLGRLQQATGAFDDAFQSFKASLALETEPREQAKILGNAADALRDLGEFADADDLSRQAAELTQNAATGGFELDAAAQEFARAGDHAWALELNDRARVWFALHEPRALPVNAEIRSELLRQAGWTDDASAQSRAMLALFDAQAAASIGERHYEEGWRRSLATRQTPTSPAMVAFRRAFEFRARRRSTEALQLLGQCIAEARRAGDDALALRAQALRGGWLFDQGSDDALVDLDAAQSEASERGLALPEISALVTMQALGATSGRVRRHPLELLCRARRLRDQMRALLANVTMTKRERAIEMNDTGAIENQLGKYADSREMWPEAADFFEQAAALAPSVGDTFPLGNRLSGLCSAARQAGQTARAEVAARKLAALCTTPGTSPRTRVVGARELHVFWRDKDPSQALRWIEHAVAAGEEQRASFPPEQRDALDRQWNEIYGMLAVARRRSGHNAEAFEALQLGKFRPLAEAIGRRIGGAQPPTGLAAIRSALAANECLLDIAAERDGLTGYVVTRDELLVVRAEGDPATMAAVDAGDMRGRAAALLALSRENAMLAQFAQRVETALPAGARLIVAPDPRLSNIPLHTIPVAGRPWCEVRELGYVPAAAALAAPQLARCGQVMVMGDARGDLPSAKAECQAVAARFRTAALTGADCTRAALVAALERGPLDVLHIATHGRGNPRQGELASLLLVEDGEARWCDLAGLTRLPWRVGLVVLSGCSTGLVGRQNSTAYVSVAEAVLRAGAGSVVACLWPVGDGAARLAMMAFHEALGTGLGVTAALGVARRRLRAPDAVTGALRDGRSTPDASPQERDLNWSAFVSLGRAEPLT